jgi:hypothetical protein
VRDVAAPRTRPDYSCRDCGIDTDRRGEYAYMLYDRVWEAATRRAQRARPGLVHTSDLCCIGCVEQRLGRPLTHLDFNRSTRLNLIITHRSARLREAMAREP